VTLPAAIGRYRIEGELGRGAMGTVYRAIDPVLQRVVAVKTLNPDLPDDVVAEMKARFVREARSAGQLNQPNIVTIYDVGVSEGVAFIAMEHLEGTSLRQMLDSGEALSYETIVDIVAQVAEALDYAGRFGIVHRDTKPANIMVSAAGVAKLTDFGLAYVPSSVMTQKGTIVGSPKYLSPEQVQEQPVDGRADIFSLGIVLYEMLTGKTPFEAPDLTLFDLMERIVKEPLPRASERKAGVPAAFDEILARALAKRPAERFQRAHEFAEALRGLRSGADLATDVEYSLGEDSGSRETLSKLLGDLEISSRNETPETLSASLRQGFHYLDALVRRVIQASPAFTVSLDLAQVGVLPAAALRAGEVECHARMLDDKEIVDHVALSYRMVSPKKARAALGAKEARRLKEHLERAGVAFEHREVKDAAGALRCVAFVIEVDLPASAVLRGDYEAQAVDIECLNVGVLGPARYRLTRAEFDEVVWDFGKLLLGFPSAFAGRRLPAEIDESRATS
jgi:serine/threonine protein kinase